MIPAILAAAVIACITQAQAQTLRDDATLNARIAAHSRADEAKERKEQVAMAKAGLPYRDANMIEYDHKNATDWQRTSDAEAAALKAAPVCRGVHSKEAGTP